MNERTFQMYLQYNYFQFEQSQFHIFLIIHKKEATQKIKFSRMHGKMEIEFDSIKRTTKDEHEFF